MRAILSNFFWAKREAVETPMPGPLPMTRRAFEDILRLEEYRVTEHVKAFVFQFQKRRGGDI